MASTYLYRTCSTATDNKKFTLSFWVKRHKPANATASDNDYLFHNIKIASPTQYSYVLFQRENTSELDRFIWRIHDGGTNVASFVTSAKFRDTTAWYHIVIKCDTSQAVSTDRVKIWINGVLETNWVENTYPSLNQNTFLLSLTDSGQVGSEGNFRVGSYPPSSNYFNGSFAHIHAIDGTAYDASTFGETDATTGIWKPKTEPSVTYGNNGFFLKFENSGSMGLDSSGNANNFTVNGTLTQTVDTPTNVFCTFNGVNPYSGTLSNGNLKMSQTSYDYNVQGSLGMASGKYYWEYKIDGIYGEFGVCEQGKAGQLDPQGNIGFYFIYNNGSGTYLWNNPTSANASTPITASNFTSGMIINFAYDADNQALYIGQNGTWLNSGDPTSGASKTGALITNLYPRFGGTIVPFCGHGSSGRTANYEANFGNGYFGTTPVSSATSDESGLGIFEYTVPSGYYALCTKNINTQG